MSREQDIVVSRLSLGQDDTAENAENGLFTAETAENTENCN